VATFTQLASGNWRVQVRRKTRYVAETFRRRKDGEEWALEMDIDRNGSSKRGAGQATLLSFIWTIIVHAAAVRGIEASAEKARLARVALNHLNLVGKSRERDGRPTRDELDELIN
jgi:hypothetical protein